MLLCTYSGYRDFYEVRYKVSKNRPLGTKAADVYENGLNVGVMTSKPFAVRKDGIIHYFCILSFS